MRGQAAEHSPDSFRNRKRFANAILIHLGGLDLYSDGLRE